MIYVNLHGLILLTDYDESKAHVQEEHVKGG